MKLTTSRSRLVSSLEGVLEAIQVSSLNQYPYSLWTIWIDILFKALHEERKKRKKRILTRLAWAP